MSKALGKIAIIAGAVALVATGVGAAAGAGLFTAATAAGAVTATAIAATAATVASVASVVAVAASIGSQALAKTPPHSGQINRITVIKEAPSPYIIGRTYFGGMLRHDAGYGATLKKVPNPYRGLVIEYGVAGPYEELVAMYADFNEVPFSSNAATGYYAGFMYRDTQLGLLTETALTPFYSGFPNWGASHILSGKAAILWNLLFDKDGNRYASGLPNIGAVWKGAKVYDPRLDSTYPGGSGAHRITNEATWTWSENPGLHALAYAYGRYKSGKLIFGVGLPVEGIEIAHFVTLANVCDANSWKVGGVIFEPGDSWANLKDILAAGAAEPLFIGGKLGVKINAPHVALDDINPEDLADDDAEIGASQTWRDRINGIFPKYRSEDHRWDYVTADLVTVGAYVTEDGEEKKEERQYNLVQDAEQAAQLAAYDLVNARELGPITLVCGPRMRLYGPGDMLTAQLPDHGLDGIDLIVTDRSIDPGTMKVTFTLVSETTAKHAFALGLTGSPPPTPGLTDTATRDDIAQALRQAEFGFALVDIANTEVGGNFVKKISGAASTYDAKAKTVESYSDGARVSGKMTDNCFIGLTTDPTVDSDYDTIDYALHRSGDGSIYSFQNGTGAVVGTWSGDEVYEVVSDNAVVRYYVDGVEVDSHAVTTVDEVLFGVFAARDVGNIISDIFFGADEATQHSMFAPATMFPIRHSAVTLAVIEGQLPLTMQLVRFLGPADKSADATWSIPVNLGSTASISSTGLLEVTDVSGLLNGYLIARSNYNGIDLDFLLSFDNVFDPPNTDLPEVKVYDGIGQDVVSSGTYADIGGIMTATAGAGGETMFNGFFGAQANDAGDFRAFFDLLQRPAGGGSWTSVQGTNLFAVDYDPVFRRETLGGMGIITSITGLTPGADYEYKLQVKKNSGTATSGRVRSLMLYSYGI